MGIMAWLRKGAAAGTAPSSPATMKVQFEDALATPTRIWLRGRLLDYPASSERGEEIGNPKVRLETRIGGHLLEADVPLAADGRFEIVLDAALPPARRGWRLARNRVSFRGAVAEACCLVLSTSRPDGRASVVILPVDRSHDLAGIQALPDSPLRKLAEPFWRSRASKQAAVYYLVCVPPVGSMHEAELAVAIGALGWPSGNRILVPADRAGAPSAMLRKLELLRRLCGGGTELNVLNLEPVCAPALETACESKADRAGLRVWKEPDRTQPQSPTNEGRWSRQVVPSDRGRAVPRYPVVFCHGLLAYTTIRMRVPEHWNCFASIGPFLEERGCRVFFPQLSPTGGVEERAHELRDFIESSVDGPFNLIAHSMGGLDARYLISRLGMADRVRSLTTICTPHRGTTLAEWFVENFRNRMPLMLALESMGVNLAGFRDCLPSACAGFNERTPDMPGVHYFSYGGSVPISRVSPALRRAWQMVYAKEGPNDGMVSLTSARWGEHLGVIHADHFAQTPDAAFLRTGEDFNSLAFFSRLVEDLARREF